MSCHVMSRPVTLRLSMSRHIIPISFSSLAILWPSSNPLDCEKSLLCSDVSGEERKTSEPASVKCHGRALAHSWPGPFSALLMTDRLLYVLLCVLFRGVLSEKEYACNTSLTSFRTVFLRETCSEVISPFSFKLYIIHDCMIWYKVEKGFSRLRDNVLNSCVNVKPLNV